MKLSALVLAAFGVASTHGSSSFNDEVAVPARRNLIFQKIWTYSPRTKVTDVAAIDLDLVVIKDELAKGNMDTAEKVYKDGGHSGSTAVLTLDLALDQDVPAGTDVLIPSGQDDEVGWGTLAADARDGDRILLVTYGTTVNQNDFVGCQVGALPQPKTSGCFVESGEIQFPDLDKTYDYTYTILTENINLSTFLELSLQAKKFKRDDPNGSIFNQYADYFTKDQYMDEIITAAFNSRQTIFSRGAMDFSIFQNKGSKEVVEYAIIQLTIWMTVIGNLEAAVEKCYDGSCETETCLERPGIAEWDSAVAFYAGSELTTTRDKGELLFHVADKRCKEFRTCGETGLNKNGNAFVNFDVFHWFARGQLDLMERYCDGAQRAKNKIIELMMVPLIQGTIRYAHMVQGEMESGDLEKHDAEAAANALAVLPLVHKCNPDDAATILENLKPQTPTNVDFSKVKRALEKNYKCMKVKCHHVGGIYDDFSNSYREGAEPCSDLTVGLNDNQKKWGIALGISFGGIFVIAFVVCCISRSEGKMLGGGGGSNNNDLQLQANTDAEIS